MSNCAKCYQKSTMKAYNTASQTLSTGNNILFGNYSSTGASIVASGSIGVKIQKAGLYLVTFSGSTVESGTAGNITAQLYRNGSAVPEAVATGYSSASGDIVNLSFSTVVEVNGSCNCVDNSAVLSVINSGVGATYSNADMTVVKLC